MPNLEYTPRGRNGFVISLVCERELALHIEVGGDDEAPTVMGAIELQRNPALVASLLAHGQNELAARRLRASEKRESHAKAAKKNANEAIAIAGLIERLGTQQSEEWCSGCFERSVHQRIRGQSRPRPRYVCANCGTPTVECGVPRCHNHAVIRAAARTTLRYCAPHCHQIPSFEKLDDRLDTLEACEEWLSFEHKNAKRVTTVTGGMLGAAVVMAPAALLAAPVVGAALGSSVLGGGLTGAAATSHGLAMLGGGAVASGGLGMAGGTAVVTAVGTGLGGILGATATSAYVSSDKSFRIEKLRDGSGPAVLLASGFLTQKADGWDPWKELVDRRYPDAPVYRVHWGSKELKNLGVFAGVAAGKQTAKAAVVSASKKGGKSFGMPGIGWVLGARDVATNPWTVAKTRAEMTGAILADLIARTEDGPFVLIGHSLGARVMVRAAETLGTRGDAAPRIETMHLLGAAVGCGGDWRPLTDAVSGTIWNYHSNRDQVLGKAYVSAQFGQKAVGHSGFGSKWSTIRDRNVARAVGGHSEYFEKVRLS